MTKFCIVSLVLIHIAVIANGAEDFDKLNPADKIKMSGDFRLRAEWDTNRDGDEPDRFRERIRLRANTQYQINDYFTVKARLATGDPDDPNSPHQTLGTVFNRAPFSVERAYVEFKYKDFWVNGGKFPHSFKTPNNYAELVWDADVHPEGIAAGYTLKSGLLNVHLTGGEYILLEQGNTGDPTLAAAQLAVDSSQKSFSVMVAGGIYKYFKLNATDIGAAGLAKIVREDNAGNATVDADGDKLADAFTSGFTIVDLFANLAYNVKVMNKSQPIALSAQFFKNLDATIDDDQGFAVGVSFGGTKAKGDFKVYYNFQLVKQDALFSAFAQDDFLAATNFQGHLFGLTYRLLDATDLNLWGLLSKQDTPAGEGFQTRLRADLNLSF